MPIAPAPKEKVFPGLPQNYIPHPKRRPLVLCLLPEIIIFVASRKRHKKSPVANTPKGRYVGAPEGNRTPDPSLKRRLLCLLSYGRIFVRLPLRLSHHRLLLYIRSTITLRRFPPTVQFSAAIIILCQVNRNADIIRALPDLLAVVVRIELTNMGAKTPCLATWRHHIISAEFLLSPLVHIKKHLTNPVRCFS